MSFAQYYKPTIYETLLYVRCELNKNNIDAITIEANQLVANILGMQLSDLIVERNSRLSIEQFEKVKKDTQKRKNGYPLAYILGKTSFYKSTFLCDKSAMIPRPETEKLVDMAITTIANFKHFSSVLDLCTGTGCIAISLLLEIGERCNVSITDNSITALELANKNATLHNVKFHRVYQTDLLVGIKDKFDIIISNPPYVPPQMKPELQPEIFFEPANAIFGSGSDGAAHAKKILLQAKNRIAGNNCAIFMEIDPDSSTILNRVANLLYPNAKVEISKDFNGLKRYLSVLFS